jgi:hypothetical protein
MRGISGVGIEKKAASLSSHGDTCETLADRVWRLESGDGEETGGFGGFVVRVTNHRRRASCAQVEEKR